MRNGAFFKEAVPHQQLCVNQIIKVHSHKLKKLQRYDHFNTKNKFCDCCISLNQGSRVIHLPIRIYWNKSEQKSGLILILSFSGWCFF